MEQQITTLSMTRSQKTIYKYCDDTKKSVKFV